MLVTTMLVLVACTEGEKGICAANEEGTTLSVDSDALAPSTTVPNIASQAIYDVLFQPGITYGQGQCHQKFDNQEGTATDLILDAFVPDNAAESRPAIVLIHGGAFNGGTREHESLVSMAYHFAARGFVAFSIDYRLKSDFGTVPQEWIDAAAGQETVNDDEILKIYPALRDSKAAMRWVVANAGHFNINPDYISVGGGSAGANASIGVAITDQEDYRDELSFDIDPTLETTHTEETYAVQAILDLWGSDIAVDTIESISGGQHFDSESPPILIVHGTEDPTVLFENAEDLKNTYDEIGVPYEYHPVEGRGHGAWNVSFNGKSLNELAFDFAIGQQDLVVE